MDIEMTPNELAAKLKQDTVAFNDVMAVIDAHYDFSPTSFKNGETYNEAGTNNGSCKVFALGQLLDLDEQSTLNAFGDFYKKDVMENPDGDDHANIRNFMKTGWQGVEFEGTALTEKA